MAEAQDAATPAPKTIDEIFDEAVKGKYKLADGPSTAQFWTRSDVADGPNIPRPDRKYKTLWMYSLLGFLGLDHFYLRSTTTGLLKLLTLGGFFLWWAWDLLQLWTEKERVLKYGLTTPFDLVKGIGQGMIAEKTEYEQTSSWTMLVLSSLVGFTGAPFMLLQRPWIVLRFVLAAGIGIALIAGFFSSYQTDGILTALKSWGIAFLFLGIFAVVFVLGVVPSWGSYMLQLLGDPDGVMSKGLTIPKEVHKVFRWWRGIFKNDENKVDPEDVKRYDSVKTEWDPPLRVTPAELRALFSIDHPAPKEEEDTTEISSGDGIPIATIGSQAGRNVTRGIWDGIMGLIGKNPTVMAMTKGFDTLSAGVDTMKASQGRLAQLASSGLGSAASMQNKLAAAAAIQQGGARNEPAVSNEAKIIGAVLVALLGGAAVKATVNSLIPE